MPTIDVLTDVVLHIIQTALTVGAMWGSIHVLSSNMDD